MTTLKRTIKREDKPNRQKTERLSMRIDALAKSRLERAAAYTRRTVSESRNGGFVERA